MVQDVYLIFTKELIKTGELSFHEICSRYKDNIHPELLQAMYDDDITRINLFYNKTDDIVVGLTLNEWSLSDQNLYYIGYIWKVQKWIPEKR